MNEIKKGAYFVEHHPSYCSGFDKKIILINDDFQNNIIQKLSIDKEKYNLMQDEEYVLMVTKNMNKWWVIGELVNCNKKIFEQMIFEEE